MPIIKHPESRLKGPVRGPGLHFHHFGLDAFVTGKVGNQREKIPFYSLSFSLQGPFSPLTDISDASIDTFSSATAWALSRSDTAVFATQLDFF